MGIVVMRKPTSKSTINFVKSDSFQYEVVDFYSHLYRELNGTFILPEKLYKLTK